MPDLNGYIWNQFKDEKLAEDKARSLKESGYDVLVCKNILLIYTKKREESELTSRPGQKVRILGTTYFCLITRIDQRPIRPSGI